MRRHKSELRALQAARAFPPLAIFPIFLTVGFWWFAACLPCIVPYVLGQILIDAEGGLAKGIGYAMLVSTHVYALVFMLVTTYWFFRWYFIAASLMVGRTGMADRKEAELTAAIAEVEVGGTFD